MSLLMEALKKAEEAKRLAGDGRAEDTHARPDSPLPDLALHLDAIDSDLAQASKQPSGRESRPVQTEQEVIEADRDRRATHNLFTAKQADNRNRRLLPLLSLALLIAFGTGGYFWWKLHTIPTQALVPPPTAKASVPAPENLPVPSIRNDNTSTTVRNDALEAKAVPAKPSVASVSRTTERTPAPSPAIRPPGNEEKRAESSPASPSIRLSRTPPRINPHLERAYAALMAERFEEAQTGYEQVLRSDAKNTDALLGLATIASRRGQLERAYTLYTLALESDPTNATARAGVANTLGQADAETAESRLKTALSEQPDSASLLFALGNLYAGQARWSEAQQAYFQAYAADPENPDFIFNVAISLDHLRKNKLAAQYYQMALAAGETRAAGFDREQARSRLIELRLQQ